MPVTRVILGFVLAAAFAVIAAGDPTPGEKCAAAKLKAAGQKCKARLRCYAKGVLAGGGVDPECLSRVESKFSSSWARIEARGGCATTGDVADIEARVDQCVADLVAALPATTSTSTTITTTSSCPPLTAFYCGLTACGPSPPALCPSGMTCVSTGPTTCECQGTAPPCGDLSGNLCQWGDCPPGMTCATDSGSQQCPPACSCQ